MSIMEQTSYVFHLAENIHTHLSKIYRNIKNQTERERLKMLLDYMSHQEVLMKSCIEEYEKCLSQKILNTWFQYAPKEIEINYSRLLNISVNTDIDEIISLALEIDDKMIEMYEDMSRNSDCESVKEAFSNLKEMERQNKKNLVRSYMRLEDI